LHEFHDGLVLVEQGEEADGAHARDVFSRRKGRTVIKAEALSGALMNLKRSTLVI